MLSGLFRTSAMRSIAPRAARAHSFLSATIGSIRDALRAGA
jgi:hypothetical protein